MSDHYFQCERIQLMFVKEDLISGGRVNDFFLFLKNDLAQKWSKILLIASHKSGHGICIFTDMADKLYYGWL